jgi:hypothetical protein
MCNTARSQIDVAGQYALPILGFMDLDGAQIVKALHE